MLDHYQPAYSVGPTSFRQWADGGPLLGFYWAHIPEMRVRSLSSCENAQSVRR